MNESELETEASALLLSGRHFRNALATIPQLASAIKRAAAERRAPADDDGHG